MTRVVWQGNSTKGHAVMAVSDLSTIWPKEAFNKYSNVIGERVAIMGAGSETSTVTDFFASPSSLVSDVRTSYDLCEKDVLNSTPMIDIDVGCRKTLQDTSVGVGIGVLITDKLQGGELRTRTIRIM
jgi:hypothetical protein